MTTKRANDRKLYMDVMRVFATLGVVFYHVAGQCWNEVAVGTREWIVYSVYANLTLWPVFIFIMLSGALFLSKDCNVTRLYTHNIFRLFISYLFWNCLYAFFTSLSKGSSVFFDNFINGHYHLWFLPMMMGLYLLVPLLKKITESDFLTKYFLILTFVFGFALPQLIKVLSVFEGEYGAILNEFISKLDFKYVTGFVVYFILGYYLSKLNIDDKGRIIKIICPIVFLFLSLMMALFPMFTDKTQNLFGNYSFTILLKSIVVYLGIKVIGEHFRPIERYIQCLSKCSFGIYLVHALVIEGLETICNFNTLLFEPIFSVPIISIVVFFISFAISWILNKLPFFNKYFV